MKLSQSSGRWHRSTHRLPKQLPMSLIQFGRPKPKLEKKNEEGETTRNETKDAENCEKEVKVTATRSRTAIKEQ